MNQTTYDQVLADIQQLPERERRKLVDALVSEEAEAQSVAATLPAYLYRNDEMRWLREHQREYANQWVGLQGDLLIAHSENAKEVFAAMDAAGIEIPFVTYVEDPDAPPYAGSSLCL